MATPPAIWQLASGTAARLGRHRSRDEEDPLAPELDEAGLRLFTRLIASADRYVEYGCGGSTILALSRSDARVFAVESSAHWVAQVRDAADALGLSDRLELEYVDLGPVGDWGTPLGFSRRHDFPSYIESPWRRTDTADLVLIDGRFRVASLCCSLLRARPGTVVLVDDYFDRPELQVVEECVEPQSAAGRMAKFVVPRERDRRCLETMMLEFTMVWG